jgi:hypothetical protein
MNSQKRTIQLDTTREPQTLCPAAMPGAPLGPDTAEEDGEERAPSLMSPGEHDAATKSIGPARAAWAYYQSWLARHRWFIEADNRGDLELIPVFAREMEKKEDLRQERLRAK